MVNERELLNVEWEKYRHFFKHEEIAARTLLLREGMVSERMFYIEKGCIRLSFNKDGKDITFQFFFEGEGVSSAESFRSNQPSLFSIETIEPCIVHTLNKKDHALIIESSPLIKQELEEQTFQRLLYYQKLFLSRIKNSPEERYKELLEQSPHILQRIPQHYIASFLGITSVSLSRIRNRK
ncbi:Crp/Fnr family transcriptional regulator [Algoriphagus lacus]|uniref:Crp/Fnr family transcriptional regulator n=1 Tax=Algoriphagus lacus TaxID=2056311 RepID=A0A418PPV5_9BACT|nr:Crp/Fnr family transcriptional regulator [Algoriphagus lacus]RIW14108.1 Crp/Fnr family transcriptional regulator [Algoriphagus lacus]